MTVHNDLSRLWIAVRTGVLGLGTLLFLSVLGATQEREVSLSDNFLASQCVGSSDEIDMCLAQLAMANDEPSFCERSISGRCNEIVARVGLKQCESELDASERWICETGLISKYPAPEACKESMDHDGCILNTAVALKTPNLIAERVSDPDAMVMYLSAYASAARDQRSLDYLEDARHHDMALVLSAVSVGYGRDKELGTEYCKGLRGGYGSSEDDMSATQIRALCRYFAGLSDTLLAQQQSFDSQTMLEQFQDRTAEQMADLIQGLESGDTDIGSLIPELENEEETSVTGSWSGTWHRNDTGASGGFRLSISSNPDGSLAGTFLGQDAIRVSRTGGTVELTLEPSSECEGAILKFVFSDGAPESGTYSTYGSAASCGRTGTYSFP